MGDLKKETYDLITAGREVEMNSTFYYPKSITYIVHVNMTKISYGTSLLCITLLFMTSKVAVIFTCLWLSLCRTNILYGVLSYMEWQII